MSAVRRSPLMAAAFFLLAGPAAAHDFWIEPSTFRPRVGERVTFSLRVGENFRGELVPRRNARIESFRVNRREGAAEISGIDGSVVAGWLTLDRQEDAVISYRSRPSYIELDGETFEQYLREEGLDWVVATRARAGKSTAPGREMFSRCAKSILGGSQTADVTRPAGLRYEIVPEDAPSAWEKTFRGRVLFEGRPVEGALVVAMRRGDAASKISVRSGARGEFRIPLPGRGVWLVKSVHMVPVAGDARADWESLWASLTFDSSI